MTVLPIVARELRVAARRRGTVFIRVAISLAAILVGLGIFFFTYELSALKTGRYIFEGLSGLLFIYCLAYGRRSTADSLSQEKREGTLGLLFLTDLQGYDVVLGKLVATSITGFYGLMAVFPVLAVPMLMGGITSGEFWRMVLVLISTFWLSLAIGVFGSALSRDFRQAMAANFLLLLLIILVPPACALTIAYWYQTNAMLFDLLYPCPAYAFYCCDDTVYRSSPRHYWGSVATIQAITWLLVMAASRIAPRTWQDRPDRNQQSGWRKRWQTWNYGAISTRPAYRKQLLDLNPFYWLAGRAQRKPAHVWSFLGAMLLWWLLGWWNGGDTWMDPAVGVVAALLLGSTLKIWLSIEAGRQLAEDRRAGAFELLLSAPLATNEILEGQLLALRRQFLRPLVVVLGVELVFLWTSYRRAYEPMVLVMWLAGMVMLVVDLVALSWVGMEQALVARSHNHATIRTLVRVLVLPWVAYGLVQACGSVWVGLVRNQPWSPGWSLHIGLWVGFGLAADLVFGLNAWRNLHRHFRELALRPYNPKPKPSKGKKRPPQTTNAALAKPNSAEPLRSSPAVPAEHLPEAPLLKRRRFARNAWLWLVLAIGGCGLLLWRHFTPEEVPLRVTLQAQTGPLRVFTGGDAAVFLLPDGSLWRWGLAGGPGGPRAPIPEPMGTNRDWVSVAVSFQHCVCVRKDGSLWEWGWTNSPIGIPGQVPHQVGSSHDWVEVAASPSHSVARRQDGTIWGWGANNQGQLGSSDRVNQPEPVQIGTNRDWTGLSCHWISTLGLRRNGTLWTWGSVWVSARFSSQLTEMAEPTQVCRETNWTSLVDPFSTLALNQSGELWDLMGGLPTPTAPAAAVGHLLLTNAASNRIALAYANPAKLYQIREPGTLWEKKTRTLPGSLQNAPDEPWRRVGRRSDWVAIWGGSAAAFGLTADGILWTWGLDLRKNSTTDVISALKTLPARLRSYLGSPSPLPAGMAGRQPAVQSAPRPLLQLVPTAPPDRLP